MFHLFSGLFISLVVGLLTFSRFFSRKIPIGNLAKDGVFHYDSVKKHHSF